MNINEQIHRTATSLVEVLDLEISGVRDGDGTWVSGNPVEHYFREMHRLLTQAAILKHGGPSNETNQ